MLCEMHYRINNRAKKDIEELLDSDLSDEECEVQILRVEDCLVVFELMALVG